MLYSLYSPAFLVSLNHTPTCSLKVLNLTYDLTPMESIAAVVSEVGIIPPPSIPVILRHYHYSGW